MTEMNWFHNNTDYPNIISDIIKKAKEDRYKYGIYYDIDLCSHDAKLLAIEKWINDGKNNPQPPTSLNHVITNYENKQLKKQ